MKTSASRPSIALAVLAGAVVALALSLYPIALFAGGWTEAPVTGGRLFAFLIWAKPASQIFPALFYRLLAGGTSEHRAALALFVANWVAIGAAAGLGIGCLWRMGSRGSRRLR